MDLVVALGAFGFLFKVGSPLFIGKLAQLVWMSDGHAREGRAPSVSRNGAPWSSGWLHHLVRRAGQAVWILQDLTRMRRRPLRSGLDGHIPGLLSRRLRCRSLPLKESRLLGSLGVHCMSW